MFEKVVSKKISNGTFQKCIPNLTRKEIIIYFFFKLHNALYTIMWPHSSTLNN